MSRQFVCRMIQEFSMSRSTSADIGARLVGLTLAVSVFGAIAQGTMDTDPASHATAAAAAVEQAVALASVDASTDAGDAAPSKASSHSRLPQ